jgi:hypothetical protein
LFRRHLLIDLYLIMKRSSGDNCYHIGG